MDLQPIQNKIHEIRGIKVMLDFDLAVIYEAPTKALKQAVKRNIRRFPPDFMFELTKSEWKELVTNCDRIPENMKHSYVPPFAFINEDTRIQLELINETLAELQSKKKEAEKPRLPIGYAAIMERRKNVGKE